jgi:hypothetical protein
MRADGVGDVHAEVIAANPAGLVVRLGWTDARRRTPVEMFQVLRMRDGRVVDMQDYNQRRAALKGVGALG